MTQGNYVGLSKCLSKTWADAFPRGLLYDVARFCI